MTNDKMKQSFSKGAGRYTSNGFIPSRNSVKKSKNGCLPVIMFFMVASAGIIASVQYFI